MMKSTSLFLTGVLLLAISPLAKSYDGIIIVLEAPLLKSPDLTSKVLQTLRKGQRVFVPREVFDADQLPEFIPTFDRTGTRAYIPTQYVKVISHNEQESKMPLNIAGHDPTDYRLPEPIPSTYPFEDKGNLRVSASFLMSTSLKSPYTYNTSFNDQNFRNELGGRLLITNKVSFDTYERFYFGFIGIVSNARNSISFKNEATSYENRSVLRGGPILTFDAFKSEKYRLALGSGFTYNYHKSSITIDSGAMGEQRLFSGYSLSPIFNTTFQVSDMLPNTDFIAGADLSMFLPSLQESKDTPEYPELWAQNDKIQQGLKTQVSAFIGIQVKY